MGKEIKIITQVYYPDIAATGELLHELALKLSGQFGFKISILTTQPNFVLKTRLISEEVVENIDIKRINTINLDKNSFWGKVLNSWDFFIKAMFITLFSGGCDYFLIPTNPPLAPMIGAINKLLRGRKYVYLVHDIYPDIAINLGYISKNGIISRFWMWLTGIGLANADKIIVLSGDMKQKILEQVSERDKSKVFTIHNWANEDIIRPVPPKNNSLLDNPDFKDRFIIEYSGNIGQIHEFTTVLESAKRLKEKNDVCFLFVGEGGRKKEIRDSVLKYNLENIKFMPFQKRENLSYSLSMANIHLVSLKNGFQNFSAPSKLYGIMAVARPFIYIGDECYISDIIKKYNCGYDVRTGDSEKVTDIILDLKDRPQKVHKMGENSRKAFEENYTLDIICKQYYELLK